MSCEREIEVEDWTLRLLDPSEAASVAAHVAVCAHCREAKAMFADERSLFEARAVVDDTNVLPPLVLPKPSRFGASMFSGRTVSAITALAACVAAVIGGARAFAPSDDCAAPVASITTTFAPPAADEVLLCRAPVSEARRADVTLVSSLAPAPLASYEPPTLACVDRATCDLEDDTL